MPIEAVLFAALATASALLAELAARARLAFARREAARVARRADRAIALDRTQREQREALERASRESESDRHLARGRRELDLAAETRTRRAREIDRQSAEVGLVLARLAETERQVALRLAQLDRVRTRLVARRAQVDRALLERAGSSMEAAQAEARRRATAAAGDEAARVRIRRLEELPLRVDLAARRAIAIAVGRCQVSHAHPHHSATIALVRGDPPELAPGVDVAAARAQIAQLLELELRHDEAARTLSVVHPDGVARELGRRSVEAVLDGRLADPDAIELAVIGHLDAIDQDLDAHGQDALVALALEPPRPAVAATARELVRTLGRLEFRTSYGQNILHHSVEVAKLCALLAREVGLDDRAARRAGLFHDIGKALDAGSAEGHPELGARLLARHHESEEVVLAARDHHQDPARQSPYAALVCAADAISAARPGARRESVDAYARRLERLEMIAHGVRGVDSAFAVQAGRELRVLVNPDEVSDEGAIEIARDVARQVKEQLDFPGRVRVTVVREKRVVDYAR